MTTSDPNVYGTSLVRNDRVRWSAVVAGLFTSLSTLAVLTLLGVAVGLSAFDVGDRPRVFGWGASIWAGISLLLAFGLGGWLTARTAGGRENAILNAAMVWILAIPLMIYVFAGGLGTLVGPGVRAAQTAMQGAVDSQTFGYAAPSPQEIERVAHSGSAAAWGTLISLLLALGAAVLGGYLGRRDYDRGPIVPRTTV